MIVADTSAIIALIDADDQHHHALASLYEEDPDAWILPWAILPEVDYLLATHVDTRAEIAFVRDVAEARYNVEWGTTADVARARELAERYKALQVGLVDGVVMAIAERVRAAAIATLDVRHFAPVKLAGAPAIFPRDIQL